MRCHDRACAYAHAPQRCSALLLTAILAFYSAAIQAKVRTLSAAMRQIAFNVRRLYMSLNFATKKQAGAHKWLTVVAAIALTACGAEHGATATLAANSAATHTDALTEGECDLDGTWAVKITVPVRWGGNMALLPGSGVVSQYVKATRTREGNVMHESLAICGTVLPDYRSRVFQMYATRFPDSLFDNGHLQPIEVNSYFNSGFTPGSNFHTDPVVSQMGVALPAPLSDPWPARGTDLHHAVDGDQDGHLGVTLVAETAPGYSLPPTSLPNNNPANKFYTAIRNIAVINGTQDSCDRATGTPQIPSIDNRLALNSHVLGCELAANGRQCSAAQTRLLDSSQPIYILDGTGTVTMVRVDAAASCKTVRDFAY